MQFADLVVLVAAAVAFVMSIGLWFTGHWDQGLFVGLWVPSILAFAAFIKLAIQTRASR